jgi:hypothetical protein
VVAGALGAEIGRLNPALRARIQFTLHDCGFSPGGRSVDVIVWADRPQPPAPCRIRLPSPAEAARTVVPVHRPETPEERIRQILMMLPPARPPGRSFGECFWRQVDERLESAMRRVGVPPSLRGHIRASARAAINRASEAIFNQVLDAAGLQGEAREAVSATVRAALQTPIR